MARPGTGPGDDAVSGRRPGPEMRPTTDMPEENEEHEVTRAEEREALEKDFGPPSGQRGDLGDSGPGED